MRSLLRLSVRGIHPCLPVKPLGFTVAIGLAIPPRRALLSGTIDPPR